MKSNLYRSSSLALCLFVSSALANESYFDVCDVSFLISPSARSICVAGGTHHKPILSQEVFLNFEDFIKRGHPQMDAEDVYKHLVVTGIRFDPCGPKYPVDFDLRKCVLPNLRVIAQVYKDGRTANAALHMVFLLRPLTDLKVVDGKLQPIVPLDPKMRGDVISRLSSMKSKNAKSGIYTAGVPAGVHPVFGNAHRHSPRVTEFETELAQLLNEYCLESQYFFTAVMFTEEIHGGKNSGQDRWVWQKGNVDHSTGKVVLTFGGIPGFLPAVKEQSFTADHNSRSGGSILPQSTISADEIKNGAIEAILKNPHDIDRSKLQPAIDATDRLENPDLALVQTDDCASCHVTTTAREYATHSLGVDSRNKSLVYEFSADPRLTSFLDDSQLLLQRSNGYRVMSFAFLDGLPSVSQRTVNESLQAAHVVNLLRK